MRRGRVALAALVVLAAVFAAYWFGVRDKTVVAQVNVPIVTSVIDTGDKVVAVSSTGEIVRFMPVRKDEQLPKLPLTEVPNGKRLKGHVLEQARVLGAAPGAFRPFIERSFYGEDGVTVMTNSGIELIFGNDSQTAKKWKSVAAVLADPSVEVLDYVNVLAPGRPTYDGEGVLLPPAP